jgi:hypothetical protein
VQVAVHPLGGHPGPEARHGVVGGPDRADVRRERRHLGHRGAQPLVPDRGELAGVARGLAQRPAQLVVHHGDGLAEPRGLAREVAAHLVGAQVRLGQQVAHAGQGHRPAVGRVGREVLQHRQGERFALERALDRPLQCGDLPAADRAQRPVQLQVGVEAGQHAAEQLEDRALAPRHRRVGLLDPEHPTRDALGDLRAGLGDEPQVAHRDAVADGGQQPFGDAHVPQPVVGHPPVDHTERDVLQLAPRGGGAADEQLVEVLARADVAEGDAEQDVVEERIALGDERGDGRHPHRADRPALRAEPPLVGQPLGQEGGELLDQSIHELSSGGVIENQ